ncbi:HAD-IIA family hydrolase [Desertihabitans brevis]|uniref:HAD-IIA family hydrolase n=1 Tax=Desertihabitans brevis TaxID=2268447 RepID=A0A367YZX2_9ACTN|nr:HAD-IIA family hydrolase [Desertihabitans brevis]RCK71455.1 HAD-IIA family hydrolase [Desertihabitans brevis]
MSQIAVAGTLASRHDVVLLDLDGVVYLGRSPVPHAADSLHRLRNQGAGVGFVTNNAARTPEEVAAHLVELGVEAAPEDVITSAQAGARLLADQLPEGSTVLVLGTAALHREVEALGLRVVDSADDAPAGVIQGYDPQLAWPRLNEAAHAVQRGAVWVATNTDTNRPTDRGLVPGHGTAVAAVRAAVDVDPLVAGKPSPPLLQEAVRRTGASRPLFVGDRLDTDVAGARAAGMASLLVLTGSHGVPQLLAAPPDARPDHLAADLRGLLDPVPEVDLGDDVARCGDAVVRLTGGRLVVDQPVPPEQQVPAAWAAARLCWLAADRGETFDLADAAEAVRPRG